MKSKVTNYVTEDTIVGIYFKVRSEQLLQQILRMVCIPFSSEEEGKIVAIFQESISNFPPKKYSNTTKFQGQKAS